jgi:hypothetical protein
MISDPKDDLDRAISRAAPQLRKEWDSPDLWPRIERALAQEARAKSRPRFRWPPFAAAAAVLAASIMVMRPGASVPARAPTFFSEQALADAEGAEEVCERAIERLSRQAGPRLVNASTPKEAGCAEKLLVLDAEISALRADVERNRYNAHLRRALAGLYREKRDTLEEFLGHGQEY